jgi:DNA replication protein DnaC
MNVQTNGMSLQIRTFIDSQGETRISRLDSYMYFRQSGIYLKAKREGYLDDQGVCQYCHGQMELSTEAGLARCICWTLEEERHLIRAQEYASRQGQGSLKDFEIWGDGDSREQLTKALDTIQVWLGEPRTWLVLAGPYGVGKSHLLGAIQSHFWPWSLYVSVPDFEQIVFDATGDRDLSGPMKVIATHPILLLDDVGADYGSKYPIAALRRVIDHRYKMPLEYPTVLTTNMSISQLEQYDGRVADRILDRHISKVLSFSKVRSWRRNGIQA